MLMVFSLQQWLHERSPVFRYTYIACFVRYISVHRSSHFHCRLGSQYLHNHLPFQLLRLLVSGWWMTVLSCTCFLLLWKSINIRTPCHKPRTSLNLKPPGRLASRTEFCGTPYQISVEFTKLEYIGNRDEWDP
jgi:hypothetical protein